MNILLITPKIPFPLDEGGKTAQYAIIDYLRNYHSLTLVLATYSHKDEEKSEKLKRIWPEVTIENIRMWNGLSMFKEDNQPKAGEFILSVSKKFFHLVRDLVLKPIQRGQGHTTRLPEIDSPWITQIAPVKTKKFVQELLKIVGRSKADIIQIDLLDYADLAFILPKEIKKVFVQHEIKFARLATALNTVESTSIAFNNYILDFVKSQELNLLRLYDGIFVFSEEDRKKLVPYLPGAKIFVTPFPVLDSNFRILEPEVTNINKLIFVGGEDHLPNKDAIEWYITEIAGEVRKHQKLILHVVGNWNKNTIEKYALNRDVLFTGFVEDLDSYCRNSVMVVPVRTGSGIRAKILYAMAQGVPVVSTSVGCEGINASDRSEMLIANDPQQFATSINSLISDPVMSDNIVENAQRFVRMKYSQKVAGDLRQQYLLELAGKNQYPK